MKRKKSSIVIEFQPGSRIEQIAFLRAFGMKGSADALERVQRMDDLCGSDAARKLRGIGVNTPEQLILEDAKILAYTAEVSVMRIEMWRDAVRAEIASSDSELLSPGTEAGNE